MHPPGPGTPPIVSSPPPDPVIYVDPGTPGAPRPGDVVVVVVDGAPDTQYAPVTSNVGRVVRLWGTLGRGDHRWQVPDRIVVHAIRRPTEAELITYHLVNGGAQ